MTATGSRNTSDQEITPGSGAPQPGTDSPVEDWFGQSVAEDAELADKLVDAVGFEEAERQFEAQAHGQQRQETRHGDRIDPHQGEHAYQSEASDHSEANDEVDRLLAVYLRDHHAAAAAGVALVRRIHTNNLGSEFEHDLGNLVTEIERDAERLDAAMTALAVEPSRTKDVVARTGEFVARLKANGHLVQYSPTSRVLELEALIAAITAKRGLWRALGAAKPDILESSDLKTLLAGAEQQLAVGEQLHGRAVRIAFRG